MTRNQFSDVRITTPNEFRAVLRVLAQKAIEENVDIGGTWEVATRGTIYNWEVEFVELAKEVDTENA